jgi:D-lactate dehydrogenase
MKILFYSAKTFEQSFILSANNSVYELELEPSALSIQSASKANGYEVISIFTADDASEPVISALGKLGVKMIAVRAAGFDNIDLEAANKNKIHVCNVPGYSPYAVAEHAVALMLSLNRKLVKAHQHVQKQNFLLDELIGFDLNKKTVGIIGTGKIGSTLAKIMHGFGCRILAYDVLKNQAIINEYNVHYVSLLTLCSSSDIISIHTPLTKDTKYLLSDTLFKCMKKGVMIINTARGSVVKTEDLLPYLESKHVGYYGMDVYEKEKGVFFFDHSGKDLRDPILTKLLSLENVLVTPHQAFATEEALNNIAVTTFSNIDLWLRNVKSENELTNIEKQEQYINNNLHANEINH